MSKHLRLSDLSPARQALVRLCQAINHGSIEYLEVQHSEPVFDPWPVTLRDVKLDSDEGPRPELALCDFVVADEVVRLISLLDELKCGIIRRVEVRPTKLNQTRLKLGRDEAGNQTNRSARGSIWIGGQATVSFSADGNGFGL